MATIVIKDLYDFYFPIFKTGGVWKAGKITKDQKKAQTELDKMPSSLEKHLVKTLGTSARGVRSDLDEGGVDAFVPRKK